ncbi:response regulator [Dankookia rubra]|uniref:Response regulator n=1 Tax=Dankookia rubra TaxID=1442381 RepID=A0A4R5QFA8_9PROT|nr:response regulator [Dankookia rubra]TDH61127.1 response regulator [Dankookia rubra]
MCVLLVEDDVLVRLTLIEFLEDAGLTVIDVGDASTALDIMEEKASGITVMITDLNLGLGDDGLMLAAKARLNMPDLRVVYATGNPRMLMGHILQPWERAFIKPFDASKLVSEVLTLDQDLRCSMGL